MLGFILWMYFWANVLALIMGKRDEKIGYELSLWDFIVLIWLGSIIYIFFNE